MLCVLKRFKMVVWRERNNMIFRPENSYLGVQLKKNIMREIRETVKLLNFTYDPGILSILYSL